MLSRSKRSTRTFTAQTPCWHYPHWPSTVWPDGFVRPLDWWKHAGSVEVFIPQQACCNSGLLDYYNGCFWCWTHQISPLVATGLSCALYIAFSNQIYVTNWLQKPRLVSRKHKGWNTITLCLIQLKAADLIRHVWHFWVFRPRPANSWKYFGRKSVQKIRKSPQKTANERKSKKCIKWFLCFGIVWEFCDMIAAGSSDRSMSLPTTSCETLVKGIAMTMPSSKTELSGDLMAKIEVSKLILVDEIYIYIYL